MGFYESEYWLNDTWGSNRQERQSGVYRPFVPDTLSDAAITLSAEASSAAAAAQADVMLLNEDSRHLSDSEPLARLILRSEAIASSKIEGLTMGAGKLLEYEALDELGVRHRTDGVEAAVLGNVAAMRHGIEEIARRREMDVGAMCDVNRMLLEKTEMSEFAGAIRERQNWIGGNSVNPLGAAYVPPKPEYVPALMDDLVRFVSVSPLPPLAVAAIAHAQLETIHPFADGNGRTGRALVHIVLRRAGIAPRVIPPVSLVLAADKPRYINNLEMFRFDEDAGAGSWLDGVSGWVEYFARAVSESCARARAFDGVLREIQQDWRLRTHPRAKSTADLLLDVLTDNPVVSIASAARLTGRSYEAARGALIALVKAGVLRQNARNRKSDLYVAQDVLDAFTRYERSLATISGDTSQERPAYPVPQRVRARSLRSSSELLAEARCRRDG